MWNAPSEAAITDLVPVSTVAEMFSVLEDDEDITWLPEIPGDPFQFVEYRVTRFLMSWFLLFVTIMGLVGNILCIVVLSMRARTNSTTVYLLALAISDLCVVINGAVVHLSYGFGKPNILSSHPAVCKICFYAAFMSTQLSGWLLVAVTFERLVVVFFPLKAKVVCTVRSAYITVISVTLFISGYNMHYFWSYDVVSVNIINTNRMISTCSLTTSNPGVLQFMLTVRPWADIVIKTLIPFSCLLTWNTSIIAKLSYESHKRKSMTEQNSEQSNISSMTFMLLIVNFVYLICLAPAQILFLIYKYSSYRVPATTQSKALEGMLWALSLTATRINHSVNFILYFMCGNQFRNEFYQVLGKYCPCKWKQQQSDPESGPANTNTPTSKLES